MVKIDLKWRGQETIDAVRANLGPSTRIEIMLPADYNHALFTHLMPDASEGQLETLDIDGNADLIAGVAEVKGLEVLAKLVEPLSSLSAKVTIQSPPRIVIAIE